MKARIDGRATMTLGANSVAVINGEVDISEWDDEELARGRRRDTNGHFTGQPPRVIPVQCYAELKRRQVFDAESTLGKRVARAAEYIAAVATGEEEPNAGRLRACELLLDRVVGKSVDRIQMSARVDSDLHEPVWMGVFRRAIHVDGVPAEEIIKHGAIPATSRPVDGEDDDIVDAEIIEEESESGLSDQCAREAHGVCRDCECVCHIRPTPDPDDEILWEDDDEDPILWED